MKATAAIVLLTLGLAVGAQEAESTAPGGTEVRGGFPASLSEKKVSDLTVGDLAELAEQRSVERQKRHYVHGAALASFVLPGAGQLIVGDTSGGLMHLAGEAALIAGTLYGSYLLLPEDLRDLSLSRGEREDLMDQYRENGDEYKLYASAGVMAGGFALSFLHSLWAARDAGSTAVENVETGKVTFEPSLYIGARGMGPSLVWRW